MNELVVRFIEVGRTPLLRNFFQVECRTADGVEFYLPVERIYGQAIFELNKVCNSCPKDYRPFGQVVSAIVINRRMRRGQIRSRLHNMAGYSLVDGKLVSDGILLA